MQAEYGAPTSGYSWVPTRSEHAEGDTGDAVVARCLQTRRGRRPLACTETRCAEPGRPCIWPGEVMPGPPGEPLWDTPVMDGCRESDSPIVSMQPTNNGSSALELAEGVERRGLAKGNLVEYHRGRTQRRETLPQAHDWVRQVLCACASSLEAGARCGSAARRDLCGGCRVTGIPTATNPKRYMSLREDVRRQRMV